MTATIYARAKGLFSMIDTEETCYQVEKAHDGKGIRKIISAMKEAYKIECRFDLENGDSYYVRRDADDIHNGTYTVQYREAGYGYSWDEKKMDGKNLTKHLENLEK